MRGRRLHEQAGGLNGRGALGGIEAGEGRGQELLGERPLRRGQEAQGLLGEPHEVAPPVALVGRPLEQPASHQPIDHLAARRLRPVEVIGRLPNGQRYRLLEVTQERQALRRNAGFAGRDPPVAVIEDLGEQGSELVSGFARVHRHITLPAGDASSIPMESRGGALLRTGTLPLATPLGSRTVSGAQTTAAPDASTFAGHPT